MTVTRTSTGRDVDLINPTPGMISFDDIAHHLSLINRYSGASDFPISVAQHSLYVVRILGQMRATPLQRLLGLLHDAHEAYIGDITSPVAKAVGALRPDEMDAQIIHMKSELDARIFKALGVQKWACSADWEPVLKADTVALATEWRFAMTGPCPVKAAPANFEIREVHWLKSKEGFIKAFRDLCVENALPSPHRNAPSGIFK